MRTKFQILEIKSMIKNKLTIVSEFLDKSIETLWTVYGGSRYFHKLAQFEIDNLQDFDFEELPYGEIIYKSELLAIYQMDNELTLIELVKSDNCFIGTIFNVDDLYLHIMFKAYDAIRPYYKVLN